MNNLYNIKKNIVSICLILLLSFGNIFIAWSQTPVGTLPGSIDVSPTGSATYTIPIEVVPGTQDIQPNLSIVYNNQAGNGTLGMKWDLAGLSAIVRTTQTIYHDNNITDLKWNNNDRFALDGNRLVVTNGKSYGSNEALYATEMETFSKIMHYGTLGNGPEYFEVITDNGTIMEYGNSWDSRQNLCGTASIWMISKVTDIHGNYMTFHYLQKEGIPCISEINYTGNSSLTPYARVSFTYIENNSTKNNPIYMGGHWYKRTSLLEKITVSYQSSFVREYQFSYIQDNRFARLSQIQFKVKDDIILNPTIITWGDDGIDKEFVQLDNTSFNCISVGDFNGDGIYDIMYLDPDYTNDKRQRKYYVYFGNIDGGHTFVNSGMINGFPERYFIAGIMSENKDAFIYACPNVDFAKYKKIYYLYYNGNQFILDSLPNSENYAQILVGDFNGDGQTEIAISKYDSQKKPKYQDLFLYKSLNSDPIKQTTITSISKDEIYYTLDFNGNGKTNIQFTYNDGLGSGKVAIYEYNNRTNVFEYIYGEGFPTPWHYCHYGDFNGDGIQDILTYGSGQVWELILGTGKGYVWPGITLSLNNSIAFDRYHYYDKYKPFIADFDGDGKDDIIQITENKINVYLTRIISENQYTNKFFSLGHNFTNIKSSAFLLGDLNNDGKIDLIYKDYKKTYYFSFFANGESALVKKITDGMGVETELDYTFFTFDKKSVRNKIPFPIVKQLKTPDGLGEKNITEYSYAAPIVSYKRRSFLGFTTIKAKNNGITTEQTFFDVASYHTMYLYEAIKYVGDRRSNAIVIGSQINYFDYFNPDNTKRLIKFNSSRWDYDFLNHTIQYTETEIYETGDYKGRVKSIFTGSYNEQFHYKEDYFACNIQEITYTKLSISSNGRSCAIVQPNLVTTTEKINNSSLEKIHSIDYSYNNKGCPDWIEEWNDHGKITTQINYNSLGIPYKNIKYADGAFYSIGQECTYDATGRFITRKKHLETGFINDYTYDPVTGNILSVKDENNLVTTYLYNSLGQNIATYYPDNTRDSFAIVWINSASISFSTESYSTGGPVVLTAYDKLGRELRKGSNGISFTDTRYNTKGEIVKVSKPYRYNNTPDDDKEWIIYTYDKFGRISSERGIYHHLCYSYEPKSVTVNDRNRWTSYTKTYDAASRPLTVTDPGGTISYSYNFINQNNKICNKVEMSSFGNVTAIITDQWGNRLSLVDPNAGTITATYNEFGDILTQTDANGTSSRYIYNSKGWLTQMEMTTSDNEITTIDYGYDNQLRTNGKLTMETISPDGIKIEYSYDNLMRLQTKTYSTKTPSTPQDRYTYSYTYNGKGQVENITYPSGFTIKHQYDTRGRLLSISTTGNNPISIYKVQNHSVFGPPNFFQLGSKIGTFMNYDSRTGLLQSIITGKGSMHEIGFEPGVLATSNNTMNQSGISSLSETAPGELYPPGSEIATSFMLDDTTIQHLEYAYISPGILRSKTNMLLPYTGTPSIERFTHDNQDRLTNVSRTTYSGNSSTTDVLYSMQYNQNKMISNSAVGDFTYHQTKPHALKQVELFNEETISLNNCTLSYTPFNKVATINEGDYFSEIKYYPNKQQAITTLKENGEIISKKYYAGKAYEYESVTNTHYHYVYANGKPVAVFIGQNNNFTPYLIHTDRLGSIDVLTDINGNVVDAMDFDAWGNRRNRLDWTQKEEGVTHLIDRGFTMHQHLDVFNLINMRGRMYDPVVGMFLSPDPYVQTPDNTQNFNRYAYCMNSPLHYIDPDGEFFVGIIFGAMLGGMINVMVNEMSGNINNNGQMWGYFGIGALAGAASAGAGAGVSTAMTCGGFLAGGASGAAAGLTSGFILGSGNSWMQGNSFGNGLVDGLKGGLIGAGTGFVIGGITGGIDAKIQKKRFWDGATVEKMVLAEQDIPIVGQRGNMNCGPASAEAIDRSFGGSMTQESIRNLPGLGGDPYTDILQDVDLFSAYCKASGRFFDAEIPYPNAASPSNVLSAMQNGERVALNLNLRSGGHGVVMQNVVQKTVTKVNGNVVQKLIYNVMNPAQGGYYMRISSESIINATNIFYIY
jgi:RHS repeat-associated protein